jgi:hypothetical protein
MGPYPEKRPKLFPLNIAMFIYPGAAFSKTELTSKQLRAYWHRYTELNPSTVGTMTPFLARSGIDPNS